MIITQTPLRISLLGGGTDFPDFYNKYGGAVVNFAIDKYVYCIVKERFDDDIYVNYSIKEIVKNVKKLKHELVRESMIMSGIDKGIEVTFLSDIPSSGSGLGSSSSVTTGILNALYNLSGAPLTTKELAKKACQIEIDILGKPIGVQDQYIAAYGGLQYMQFNQKGIKVTPVRINKTTLSDFNNYFLVFFTGRTRSASTILSEQKHNIQKKVKILQYMAAQAKVGKELLEDGKISDLGQLLNEGWVYKKQLARKISDEYLDNMYNTAIKAGALGGKISGAGGGGFLTLITEPDKKNYIRKKMSKFREMPISISRDGSKVIFNINRY